MPITRCVYNHELYRFIYIYIYIYRKKNRLSTSLQNKYGMKEKKRRITKINYRQKIISGICPSSTFVPLFSPDAKNRKISKKI